MAIIAPQTSPNFAIGDYHRILKAELLCAPDEPIPKWHILVGFYANEYARDQNPKNPLYVNQIFKPIADLVAEGETDPRVFLYGLLMKDELFAGTNAAPDVDPTEVEETAPPVTEPAPEQ